MKESVPIIRVLANTRKTMDETQLLNVLDRLKEQLLLTKRSAVFLPPDNGKASMVRSRWNIKEASLLGAIVYGTGGIVIDGWVRLLASGERDIVSWNDFLNIKGYVVVAVYIRTLGKMVGSINVLGILTAHRIDGWITRLCEVLGHVFADTGDLSQV